MIAQLPVVRFGLCCKACHRRSSSGFQCLNQAFSISSVPLVGVRGSLSLSHLRTKLLKIFGKYFKLNLLWWRGGVTVTSSCASPASVITFPDKNLMKTEDRILSVTIWGGGASMSFHRNCFQHPANLNIIWSAQVRSASKSP